MQTLQHRAIFVKKSVYYGTMILIHENKKNKTTGIECLTANGSEKEKVMDQFLDSRTQLRYRSKKMRKVQLT